MTSSIGLPHNGVEDRGWQLYLTSLIMIIFAGIFVIIKCATRMATKQFGSDDYTIVASLVFSIWLSVMIQLAVVNGYGTHMDDLTDHQLGVSLRFFWIAQVAYKLVVCLNKVSVTLFSKRIFTTRPFRIACWCVLAILIGWGIGALFATIFQCVPVEGSWNPTIKATCIDKDAFWTAYAVGNVITDVMVLSLPLPMIFQLHLKMRDKIGIAGIFLLGAFVTVCSIVRATVVSNSLQNQQDITYNFIPRGIWTLLEANIGIICACLPLMKQTLRKVFPRWFPATHNNSAYYTLSHVRSSTTAGHRAAPQQGNRLSADNDSYLSQSRMTDDRERKTSATSHSLEHDSDRSLAWPLPSKPEAAMSFRDAEAG